MVGRALRSLKSTVRLGRRSQVDVSRIVESRNYAVKQASFTSSLTVSNGGPIRQYVRTLSSIESTD